MLSKIYRNGNISGTLWFINTVCLQDQDQDWDEWLYIEPFILHPNRNREEWVHTPFSCPETVSGGRL